MFLGTETKYDRDGAGFTTKGNLIATYPSGIVAGELLIMFVHRNSGGATLAKLDGGGSGIPAGWHGSDILASTSFNQMDLLYKEADGTETGTFTITTSHGWALMMSRAEAELSAIDFWIYGANSSAAVTDSDMKFQLIGSSPTQVIDGNVVSNPDDILGDLITPEDRGMALDVYTYGWSKNPGPPDDPTITDVFGANDFIDYTYFTPTALDPKRTKQRDVLVLHPKGLLGANGDDTSSRIAQNGLTGAGGGASGNLGVRMYLYRDNDTEGDPATGNTGGQSTVKPMRLELRDLPFTLTTADIEE